MKKVVKPEKLGKTLDELYEEFRIVRVEHKGSRVTIFYDEVLCLECLKRAKPVRMKRHGFVREGDKTLSSFVCPVCRNQELVGDESE